MALSKPVPRRRAWMVRHPCEPVMTGSHDSAQDLLHRSPMLQRHEPTPQRLNELVALVTELLDAQGRRHGLAVGTAPWHAVSVEIDDLTRRVWRPREEPRSRTGRPRAIPRFGPFAPRARKPP